MRGLLKGLLAFAVCSAIVTPTARSQQPRPAITGRITERGTNTPIAAAIVVIAGTQRGARSDERGQYRMPDVAPGTYTLRVTRLGYAASSQVVNVSGANVAADFVLQPAAVQIDQVVVTSTGATERKRENGNDVGIIKPGDKLSTAATPTLTQALQGQEAGLTITSSSGTPGASSRIRIRGANSVSLSNEPLLIIDGVRIDNSTTGSASFVGGQITNRFDDINPEEIESIEVLKGPAASALYGTAAANGVLQITTKRGHSGKTTWRAYTDYGQMKDPTTYPSNYYVMGTNLTTGRVYNTSCTLDARTQGKCRPDSTFSFNPLEYYHVQGTGHQVDYGLSATGGGDAAQYYISGDVQKAQGIVNPNKTHNVSLRANITTEFKPNLTATFTSNYIDRLVALPINDNNIYGVVPNGILGKAFNCDTTATGGAKTICGLDVRSHGFYSRPPSEFFFQTNQQIINRFIGGANVTWQALPWLTAVGQAGLDVDHGLDQQVVQSNISDVNSSLANGYVTEYRRQIPTYTASGTVTATRNLVSDIVSSTSVGSQYINEQNHYQYGFGRNLIPGTGSLAGATAGAVVTDNNQTVVTIGTYGREQIAWRDRLFVTGGLRADRNSAFGTRVSWAYYPSASVSWVISEESFLKEHAPSWLDQVRLRGAYGQSGQRPAFRQAETYLNSAAVAQGSSETAGVVIGGTGNSTLKPEISIETEGGFDASFFNNRLGLQYTYYHKVTRDALIAAVLAPSLGVSTQQYVNLGKVLNAGNELTLNVTPLDYRGLKLDLTAAASTNNNKLLNLGGQPAIFFNGGTQRHFEGYPLGAYFQQHYTYKDVNGDHIISRSEITYGDTSTAAEYIGPVLPTHQLAITPTLSYRGVRISALFDMRRGNYLYNQTEEFRCTTSAFQNCRAVSDSTAPLDEQAAAIAKSTKAAGDPITSFGYIQPAGFTKLRELSATLTIPSRYVSRAGFSSAALTVAGHNLKTWTKYKGYDPEVLGTVSSLFPFTTVDFLTQPPLRAWTARIDLNF